MGYESNRPRIKLQPTVFDRRMEQASVLCLVLLWGITLFSFLTLPGIIPTHFNASGEPDAQGSKYVLWILPAIGTLIYLGITQLNKYPHIFNYAVTITEQNAAEQYSIATRLLRFLKLAILLIFACIVLYSYLSATGITNGPGPWFLPVTMGFMLIPVIISVARSIKSRKPSA